MRRTIIINLLYLYTGKLKKRKEFCTRCRRNMQGVFQTSVPVRGECWSKMHTALNLMEEPGLWACVWKRLLCCFIALKLVNSLWMVRGFFLKANTRLVWKQTSNFPLEGAQHFFSRKGHSMWNLYWNFAKGSDRHRAPLLLLWVLLDLFLGLWKCLIAQADKQMEIPDVTSQVWTKY